MVTKISLRDRLKIMHRNGIEQILFRCSFIFKFIESIFSKNSSCSYSVTTPFCSITFAYRADSPVAMIA